MKTSDYQSLKQANEYYNLRFKNLYRVDRDEITLLENWLRSMKFHDNSIFLDLGTGTGRVLKVLLEYRPKTIHALDQSEAMLEYLGKLYKTEINSKKIKPIKAKANKTPVKSASVNLVSAFHLFKHLPEIASTLREINRILRPRGYLIFDVLNKNSIIRFNLGTCFALTEEGVRKELETEGLKVIEIKYLHNLGETIYNIPYGEYLVHQIDKLISFVFPKSGTKIFIVAQKHE